MRRTPTAHRTTAARRAAAVLTVSMLAAAYGAGCGDDDDDAPDFGAIEQRTTTTKAAAGDSSTTHATPGGAPGTTSATQVAPTTGAAAITSTTAAPQVDADVEVGKLAGFYLRPESSERVVVEVRAQSGAAPRAATVDHLTRVLRDVAHKTVSVDTRTVGGGARSWSAGSLRRLADDTSAHSQTRAHAVVRLLFLHGDFEGDERVLGIAVRGDVAAVFVDQVDAAGGLLTGAGALEDAVTMHELGHLLGLVDLFTDTGRDDPEHPGHSRNPESVMYWAVESSVVSEVLTGGPPRDFDAADRADLARIRSG